MREEQVQRMLANVPAGLSTGEVARQLAGVWSMEADREASVLLQRMAERGEVRFDGQRQAWVLQGAQLVLPLQ